MVKSGSSRAKHPRKVRELRVLFFTMLTMFAHTFAPMATRIALMAMRLWQQRAYGNSAPMATARLWHRVLRIAPMATRITPMAVFSPDKRVAARRCPLLRAAAA
jgi:hypothetical protein